MDGRDVVLNTCRCGGMYFRSDVFFVSGWTKVPAVAGAFFASLIASYEVQAKHIY